MYLNWSDPNTAFSVTPVDTFVKVWNIKTQSLRKKIMLDGIFSSDILPLDEQHLMLWDHSKTSLFVICYITGKIVRQIEGMCDTPSSIHANTWVHVKETSEVVTLTKSKNKLQLHNWKTGRCHCVKRVRIRSFSGPYFPAFGLDTERYSVSLRSQSEYGKMQTRKTPSMDTFHAVCTAHLIGESLFRVTHSNKI